MGPLRGACLEKPKPIWSFGDYGLGLPFVFDFAD
jgi:hypothetical protein